MNCSECDSLQNTQLPTPTIVKIYFGPPVFSKIKFAWPTPWFLPPPLPPHHIKKWPVPKLAHNTEKRSLLHFWPYSLRIFSKTSFILYLFFSAILVDWAVFWTFLDFTKLWTRWNFESIFLKIVHQKGLFDAIKENPNFPNCWRILDIYWQWLLKQAAFVPRKIALIL